MTARNRISSQINVVRSISSFPKLDEIEPGCIVSITANQLHSSTTISACRGFQPNPSLPISIMDLCKHLGRITSSTRIIQSNPAPIRALDQRNRFAHNWALERF